MPNLPKSGLQPVEMQDLEALARQEEIEQVRQTWEQMQSGDVQTHAWEDVLAELIQIT
ncbi:hypothetical protein RZS08_12935 [Arthrospira platensis SPKY1]|nr:hypothetical protein [Arthrospira platensis SPKY1]